MADWVNDSVDAVPDELAIDMTAFSAAARVCWATRSASGDLSEAAAEFKTPIKGPMYCDAELMSPACWAMLSPCNAKSVSAATAAGDDTTAELTVTSRK